MGNEWSPCELGDLVSISAGKITTDKLAPKGYISTDNMNPDFGGIDFNHAMPSVAKVTEFIPNDILFSNIRTYFRKLWLSDRSGGCSNDVIVFRANSGCYPKYLFYLLMDERFIQHTVQTSKGTKMPRGDKSAILQYQTFCPALPEQKRIAHILGSLDDKIELNRQMNQTLEAMAQAVFKSWFVDFDPVIDNALEAGNPIPEPLQKRAQIRQTLRNSGQAKPLPDPIQKRFPNRFTLTDEMGWVPEGWEVRPLDTIINLIGGGTPKTSIEEYWNGNIPWFSVVDAPNNSDVFVVDTEKKITQLGLNKSSTKLLRKGATIISARGTVGKCALVGTNMAMNQSCYGIVGANGIADIYTYFSIREFVSDLQLRGHGSVFNTITRETFKSITIPFSNSDLTHCFDKKVEASLEHIRENLLQNRALSKLRDTLLPKLISGELRIEAQIKEAVA